jgi:SOS-response transcriptional repressor LexA
MEKYQKKIIGFYRQARRMPSYGEIAKLLGFKSKNAAYKLVKKMVELDLVAKDSSGKIIPRRIFGLIKVLGTVEAGFPSPAEEELVDTMTLDEYLVRNK